MTPTHSPVRAVALVAGREITTRVMSKAYLWTTGLLVLGIVVAGVLIDALGGRAQAVQAIGLTPATASLAPEITGAAQGVGVPVEIEITEQAPGEERVLDGTLQVLMTGTPQEPTAVVRTDAGPALELVLAVLAQQLALDREISALGGDPASVAQAVATATPEVLALEAPDDIDEGRAVVGLLGGVLIFIALTTTGQLVAQGVVEEKTSRVVELLLATVRPWELMAGKVLGIGAIGLLQLVLVAGAGAGTAAATGILAGSEIDLTASVAWLLLWFVLGYAMYSLVLAAAAALVSRQEDVGSVIAPVIVLMMIPYMLGVTVGLQEPGSPTLATMSFFPLFSPILMPIRISTGVALPWEMALTVGLAVVLVPLLVWLTGRVYGNAVLRTGARVSLRAAIGRDA